MQPIAIVTVALVGAYSLVTRTASAQDAAPATGADGAPSSIVVEWPAAEGGELELIVLDGDGAPRTVEQEAGRERLVITPDDLHGHWSVCVMNPTDLYVEYSLTVTIAGHSRTLAGSRDPHTSGPCQPSAAGFVTALTLGAPRPSETPSSASHPAASRSTSDGGSMGAVLHLLHDMGGHQHVEVDQNGDHSECETPCALPVAPGRVHLRAGRFDGEVVADVGRHYYVSLDVGWDDPSYVVWIVGLSTFAIGVAGTAVLSALTPTHYSTCTTTMPGPGTYSAICGISNESWFGPLLLTSIAMGVVGGIVALVGLAEGPNGAAHVSTQAPHARLGLDGLTVTW